MPSDTLANKPQILVVEDDQDTLEAIAAILDMEGFAVLTAGNGQEALELLEIHNPSVVLLDLMMPVLSGWEFLRHRKIRPQLAKIPVILTSAVMDIAAGAEAEGADAVLRKPVNVASLVGLVRQLSSSA